MKVYLAGGVNASLAQDHNDYKVYGLGGHPLLKLHGETSKVIAAGGRVAFCIAALPTKDHIDNKLKVAGIDTSNFDVLWRDDTANWADYQAVFISGGQSPRELYNWLKKNNFSKAAVAHCDWIGGESAGAYVLSRKFLIEESSDGSIMEIEDGFIPELNVLVGAHVNNPYYHGPALSQKLQAWCLDHGVEYLPLEENQIAEFEI